MSSFLASVLLGTLLLAAVQGQSTTGPGTAVSTTTSAPSTSSTPPVTTPATTTVSNDVVQHTCDLYCQGLNGPESFCKSWLDSAVCQIGNQPCGTLDICGPAVTTQAPATTGTSVFNPQCDEMCQSLNDANSYCKWWKDVPVCSGGDQPCGDVAMCSSQTWPPASTPSAVNGPHQYHSPTCDVHCQSLNDEGSYCKWWMSEPVCQGGNQACTPDDCGAGESTPAVTTDIFHMGQNANCDAYCEDINPNVPGAHCKWWLHIAVCHQGDQVCTPSVCETYTSSP
ncbi:hypothetical protein FOZ60_000098 [Perkinsus olseni]|uniref:Immunoglobulin super DCC subclass member n=1 Tax=Perkinsus olseni TaxID=32597 RepID=A0A7J6PNM6_PEROL|nr:hypothetical protein FOZ60_000098 [Perkinsus olseni]